MPQRPKSDNRGSLKKRIAEAEAEIAPVTEVIAKIDTALALHASLYRAGPRIEAGCPGNFSFGPTSVSLPPASANTCKSLSM